MNAETNLHCYALIKRDRFGRIVESLDGKNWEVIAEQWIPPEAKKQLEKIPKNVLFRMREDGTLFWNES